MTHIQGFVCVCVQNSVTDWYLYSEADPSVIYTHFPILSDMYEMLVCMCVHM
jgi:hypothetical protein